MLRNQLALTEGVTANRRAFTEGFKQFKRLANMQELPPIEGDNQEPSTSQLGTERSRTTPTLYDIEKKFNNQDRQVLTYFEYPRPNDFFNTNPTRLQEIYDEVTNDKTVLGNKIGALKRTKNKKEAEKKELDINTMQHGVVSKCRNFPHLNLASLDLQLGEGINHLNQLIDRLKLLGGSIMAGNNGVVPEFTQIANYLNLIKVLPTTELKKMIAAIKKYLGMK